VIRRSILPENSQESVLALGDFVFNLDSKEAFFKGEPLELTKTETSLIEYLMKNKNKLLTKENLITHVWGYDKDIQTRTVDVHVGNIRKKFNRYKDMPFTVVTVHSLGYKLVTK
jgi:DNA-binding response OmpR family regulator